MSKPINVEAQRIEKLLKETCQKLEILSYLTSELFDALQKSEQDLSSSFGRELAELLRVHAELEQSFKANNVGPDGKMTELDDEFLPEEAKGVAASLKKTTLKLVRTFYLQPDLLIKLRSFFGDQRSSQVNTTEMIGFLDACEDLKKLWGYKLVMPIEEELTMKTTVERLITKKAELETTKDTKKEQLSKYMEEQNEQKEQRENEINTLRRNIAEQNASKATEIDKIIADSDKRQEENKKTHEDRVKKLKARIDALEKELEQINSSNQREEIKLRGDCKRAETNFKEKLNEYDQEMEEKTEALEKLKQDYEVKKRDLQTVEEMYRGLQEEKERKELEDKKMREKEDKRSTEYTALNQAAEWIQAHWQGLRTRRDFEKILKARKKGRKKKKK